MTTGQSDRNSILVKAQNLIYNHVVQYVTY